MFLGVSGGSRAPPCLSHDSFVCASAKNGNGNALSTQEIYNEWQAAMRSAAEDKEVKAVAVTGPPSPYPPSRNVFVGRHRFIYDFHI